METIGLVGSSNIHAIIQNLGDTSRVRCITSALFLHEDMLALLLGCLVHIYVADDVDGRLR